MSAPISQNSWNITLLLFLRSSNFYTAKRETAKKTHEKLPNLVVYGTPISPREHPECPRKLREPKEPLQGLLAKNHLDYDATIRFTK